MSVVVVGSLNMDIVMLVDQMPIIGETLLGEDVRYFYGGKGANQAVAASKMNVPVKMVGKVGDDTFGDKLLLHMGMTQVAMSEVKREAGTRTGTGRLSNCQKTMQSSSYQGLIKKSPQKMSQNKF